MRTPWTLDRILALAIPEPNSGCWLWERSLDKWGYAKLGNSTAHRKSYELAKGAIPDRLTIDHRCRVRCCVNPEHLEPVTNRVNTLRGISPHARNARKTHCNGGHLLEGLNLAVRVSTVGRRRCLLCERIAGTAYRARKRSV